MLEQASELVSKWREPPPSIFKQQEHSLLLQILPYLTFFLSIFLNPLRILKREKLKKRRGIFFVPFTECVSPFDVVYVLKKSAFHRRRWKQKISCCFFLFGKCKFGALTAKPATCLFPSWVLKCSRRWRSRTPAHLFLPLLKHISMLLDGEVQRPFNISRFILSSPQNCRLWIRIEKCAATFVVDASSQVKRFVVSVLPLDFQRKKKKTHPCVLFLFVFFIFFLLSAFDTTTKRKERRK